MAADTCCVISCGEHYKLIIHRTLHRTLHHIMSRVAPDSHVRLSGRVQVELTSLSDRMKTMREELITFQNLDGLRDQAPHDCTCACIHAHTCTRKARRRRARSS